MEHRNFIHQQTWQGSATALSPFACMQQLQKEFPLLDIVCPICRYIIHHVHYAATS